MGISLYRSDSTRRKRIFSLSLKLLCALFPYTFHRSRQAHHGPSTALGSSNATEPWAPLCVTSALCCPYSVLQLGMRPEETSSVYCTGLRDFLCSLQLHSGSLNRRRLKVLLLQFLLQDIENDLRLYLIFIILNKIPCLRSECKKPYSLMTTDMAPSTRMMPAWVWLTVVSLKPPVSHRLPVSGTEM